MQAIVAMIAEKYPAINTYLCTNDGEQPVFNKFLTMILCLRQKIGYTVNAEEPFYNNIHTIDQHIFADVHDDDMKKVLYYIIQVSCCYINDANFMEDEHKQKTIQRLVAYAK
jgi:hypothetical protein